VIAVFLPKPESLNSWLWNAYKFDGAIHSLAGKGEVKALTADDAKAEVAEVSGADEVFLFATGA
jgi:hypothetical protein